MEIYIIGFYSIFNKYKISLFNFDEKLPTITEILTEKSYNIGGFELNIIYHDENIEIELP